MIHPSFDETNVACFGSSEPPDAQGWKVGQVLTVGQIVDHKGRTVKSLILEPQGIAHLISAEDIRLPSDVCGLAHVLTRKCNQGLLTLNIGVIDPGWRGKISTSILNFSSERRLLAKGDKFIRVTFHRVSMEQDEQKVERYSAPGTNEYRRDVCSRAVDNFGKHFLNIDDLVGQASEKENARLRKALLKYLPLAAFSLAIFALFVTVGGATLTRILSGPDRNTLGAQSESRAEILLLERRLSTLEQLVKSQTTRSTSTKFERENPKKPDH